jgi:hypothetical protein
MIDANGQINRQNDHIYAASKNEANNDMGLDLMKKCFEPLGMDF